MRSADSPRRNRDFVLLWTGQAVSTLGSEASFVAFPLLALLVTDSAGQAGLVGFMNKVPLLLLYLPAGALVDRYDRKAIMFWSCSTAALVMGGIAAVIAGGNVTIAHLLVAAFLQGACSVVFELAEWGALANVVPDEQLGEAIALNEARSYAARLGGPPLGGLLLGLGRSLPFLVDAVTYAALAVNVRLLRRPLQERRTEEPRAVVREIREALRFVWRQPFLRMSSALVAASNFAWSALSVMLIVGAREAGASNAVIGVMFGLIAAGGLIGAMLAPRILRLVRHDIVVVGIFWGSAAVFATLLLTEEPLLRGLLVSLGAAAGPAWNAVVVSAELRLTPDALRGRVDAAFQLLSGAAVPLGALAGGIVSGIDAFGGVLAIAAIELGLAVAASRSRTVRGELIASA